MRFIEEILAAHMQEHRQKHRQWQYNTYMDYVGLSGLSGAILNASFNVATATIQAKFSKRQTHAHN